MTWEVSGRGQAGSKTHINIKTMFCLLMIGCRTTANVEEYQTNSKQEKQLHTHKKSKLKHKELCHILDVEYVHRKSCQQKTAVQ